jgi:hypothetical protein
VIPPEGQNVSGLSLTGYFPASTVQVRAVVNGTATVVGNAVNVAATGSPAAAAASAAFSVTIQDNPNDAQRTLIFQYYNGSTWTNIGATFIQAGAGFRIYIENPGNLTTATLRLTQEANYNVAYFQFGGVYGYVWNGSSAAYNPVSTGTYQWSSSWNGDPTIHTAASLLAGKGDPCRLVGYTVQDIRTEIAAGRTPDNGLWRIATSSDFSGFTGSWVGWDIVGSTYGRFFPYGSRSFWLPALGMLSPQGTGSSRGYEGRYWTGDFFGGGPSGNAQSFEFIGPSGGLVMVTGQLAASLGRDGMAVRCVRQ